MFNKGIFIKDDRNLFSGPELKEYFNKIINKAIQEIESFEDNYILNNNVDNIIQYLESRYYVQTPILYEDKVNIEKNVTKIDVSEDFDRAIFRENGPCLIEGTAIKFFIPFKGDSKIFEYCLHQFQSIYPKGIVGDDNIQFIIVYPPDRDVKESDIKNVYQRNLDEINRILGDVDAQIKKFNSDLKNEIKGKLEFRKNKALKDHNIVYNLGFPLRKREDVLQTYTVPKLKKKIIPKPVASTKPSKPESTLEISEYENIIRSLSSMSKVIELSPNAFSKMNEENLRFLFLIPLNLYYEGQATGETFNFEGKTDILIRTEGKNIFIAECAFWRGPKYFSEKIDQLLNYVSWRDTKTAILIFNKTKDLSNRLGQIPNIVGKHPNFKRKIEEYKNETSFRFVLHHRDDKNKELILTVLVFEVPE